MKIDTSFGSLRPWQLSDAQSLACHANNPKIAINLRDAFPHPYTIDNARQFLTMSTSMNPQVHFAIVVEGHAVGGIGLKLGSDVERVSAEIGYWLSEAYWGRNIVTEAVVAYTKHAIATHSLTRVFALPFSSNPGSCRVLEKAGYLREALLRKTAIKAGQIKDQVLYSFVVEDSPVAK